MESFFIARMMSHRRGDPSYGRWHGISSDALIICALHGGIPEKIDYPKDEADLMSCERTYQFLPEKYLTASLEQLMKSFRAHVNERMV